MEIKSACLVLADISGYTRFIKFHHTSLLHAEQIITELLETIIDAAEFPLTVSKLEGDAVLLNAVAPPGAEAQAAQDVTRQVERFFKAYHEKERALIACENGCVCQACQNIGQLRLKAIAHYGPVTVRRIRQFEELSGAAVFLARQLLKNSVPAQEYLLMTETFYKLSGGLTAATPERHVEHYAELGEVPTVYFLMPGADSAAATRISAAAFSGRLNRHSFARMLGLKSRQTFNNLEAGKSNLVLYLLEGIFSGLNVLKRRWLPHGN